MSKTLAFGLAVVLVVAIALIFVGCSSESTAVQEDPRFEKIYKTDLERDSVYRSAWVIRDRETGVEYLFVHYDCGCGLCPLYDENGNVVVSEASGKEDAE